MDSIKSPILVGLNMDQDQEKTHMRGLEGPLGEEETSIFTRPSEIESEGAFMFVHPSGKESEAEASDCSLVSTASTASGSQTRKRRQPYLCKPGKAKKTAVDEADMQDPFLATSAIKSKKDLPTVEEIQRELTACSSEEIKARICESMSNIEKVADSSRSLKGAQAQNLRIAARSALAASSELSLRFSISDGEKLKKENEDLRLQLDLLKSQVTSLTMEVRRLRQRGNEVGLQTKRDEEVNTVEDPLMQSIATLMDEKLAKLRAEMFPEKNNQQSTKQSMGNRTDTTPNPELRNKKKEKLKQKKDTHLSHSVTEDPVVPLGHVEAEQTPAETWARVTSRKRKTAPSVSKKVTHSTADPSTTERMKKKAKPTPAPKTAAVTITLTEGATVGYAEAMATARQRINLADCGISQVRQKKAMTGGLLLEISGPDSAKKADTLAEKLRDVFINMGVCIARPVKTGELRVMDLDESITKQEVAAAIAEAGGCSQEEVKVGDVRFNASRLGTVWVRCPLSTVRKLGEMNHVRIGWISARLQILAARKLQCFRCLEKGHVRQQCTNPEDRSQCCYNCGEQGHKARECGAQVPKCLLCAQLGRPADHRLGGVKCNPPKKKKIQSGLHVASRRTNTTAQSANQLTGKANETKTSTS